MYGQYERTLDDKNRVVIPTKFRDDLTSKIYLSLGFENVIELRSEQSFKKMSDEIMSKNQLDKTVRQFTRAFFARTYEITIDRQSRINMPVNLMQIATIKKNVVFVGTGDKVEIWDKDKYDQFQIDISSEKFEDLAQLLSDKGM